jgi:uncharacterized protein
MDTLPLFPLNTVIFPKGRISLQIFETRYVDMVRACLRQHTGFGVVLIRKGSEVAQAGQSLDVQRTGTYVEIVDWNQLANGLLGITVEGRKTFRVEKIWREADALNMANVTLSAYDTVEAEPVEVEDDHLEYVELLRHLSRHPAIEVLGIETKFDNLREVVWRLADLLPISNLQKQSLLEQPDPLARLELIEIIISKLDG